MLLQSKIYMKQNACYSGTAVMWCSVNKSDNFVREIKISCSYAVMNYKEVWGEWGLYTVDQKHKWCKLLLLFGGCPLWKNFMLYLLMYKMQHDFRSLNIYCTYITDLWCKRCVSLGVIFGGGGGMYFIH